MSWSIDPSHSQIVFKVRHMMITNVTGLFTKFEGTISFDESNLTGSQIEVNIDPASVNTRDEKRDGHLKSPDFFDVASYPTITFKSTKIASTGGKSGQVTGDLTMHGVTKSVTLDVEFLGVVKSPFGTQNAGFTASTKINRKDWGLGWNVGLEAGGVLVGEDVTVNIEVELVKQLAPAATVEATA